MPYSPMTSFNYTPMSLPQIAGAGSQAATQGLDFARWLSGQGLDLANLVRADRNTQLAVENAYRQQQANRAYEAQRLAQDAALRQENWSRSLQNPAVSAAIGQNVASAFASPMGQDILDRNRYEDVKNQFEQLYRSRAGIGAPMGFSYPPYGYKGNFGAAVLGLPPTRKQ